MTVDKFVLLGGVFVNVSNDFTPFMNTLLAVKGQVAFVDTQLSSDTLVKLAAGYLNNPYKVAMTVAEFTALKSAGAGTVANLVDGNVYQSANGTTWTIMGTIAATLPRGRFYYSALTKKMFLLDLSGAMHPVGRIPNGLASQSDVTGGTGTGFVTPVTLKNAIGGW